MEGEITSTYELLAVIIEHTILGGILVLVLVGLHKHLQMREESLRQSVGKLIDLIDKLIDKKDPG